MPARARRGRNPIYGTPTWRRMRLFVLRRDGYRCQMRGPKCIGRAITADHITPLDEGGAPYDPANLRAACSPCNSRGGAEITNTRRALGTPSRDW